MTQNSINVKFVTNSLSGLLWLYDRHIKPQQSPDRICLLHNVTIAEAVLPYLVKMALPASLLSSPSKCHQFHQLNFCKILLAHLNILLWTYPLLSKIQLLMQIHNLFLWVLLYLNWYFTLLYELYRMNKLCILITVAVILR